jgi:hypothetical protein
MAAASAVAAAQPVVPGQQLLSPAAGVLATPQSVPDTSGVPPAPKPGPQALAYNPGQQKAAPGMQARMQPVQPVPGAAVLTAAPSAAGVLSALPASGAGGLINEAAAAGPAAAGSGAGPPSGAPLLLQSRSKQKRARNSAGVSQGAQSGQTQQQQGAEKQPEGDPFLALLLGKAPNKQ